MLQRKMDEGIIHVYLGESASRGLSDLKAQLALVQSAYTLALEGTTRATASQIAVKALQDYKVETSASFTGQVFSSFGINSVTTHGKNKFVLDTDQLEEIRKDIVSRCEQSSARLKKAIEKFQDSPQKIEELQKELKQVLALRAREQELIRLINADRQNPPRMDYLEAEYKKIQQRNERISNIKKEAEALELKEKKLPSLEERKKKLESKIAEHEKKTQALIEREQETVRKEQETAQRESVLVKRIEKLVYRSGWVELATLNQEIETAKKELDQLSKQLGEKRTILDKLFHRKEGDLK